MDGLCLSNETYARAYLVNICGFQVLDQSSTASSSPSLRTTSLVQIPKREELLKKNFLLGANGKTLLTDASEIAQALSPLTKHFGALDGLVGKKFAELKGVGRTRADCVFGLADPDDFVVGRAHSTGDEGAPGVTTGGASSLFNENPAPKARAAAPPSSPPSPRAASSPRDQSSQGTGAAKRKSSAAKSKRGSAVSSPAGRHSPAPARGGGRAAAKAKSPGRGGVKKSSKK